jgi:long-chain acyl-CoA synthetase
VRAKDDVRVSVYDRQPWLTTYPADLPTAIHQEHGNMVDAWATTVAAFPDAASIHYVDRTFSHREVDGYADALAVALSEGGLRRGDRVGLYLQNDPQWPVAQLAVWKAGGVVVPLNPMLKAHELAYLLRDAGVTVVICLGSLYETVRASLAGSSVERVIVTSCSQWAGAEARSGLPSSALELPDDPSPDVLEDLLRRNDGRRPEPISLASTDVAMLTYTSGTTGPPKGAMNTHGNCAYNSQVLRAWFSLSEQDVILGAAPLFHITGSIAHLGMSQLSGASVVLMHRFDPGPVLAAIERHRATVSIAAITAYIALMDHEDVGAHDLSSLRKAASGGAPVSPAVVERFEAVTGAYIHNVYGLTESTSPALCTPLGLRPPVDPRSGALSVGVPIMGAMVRIVDLESRVEVDVGTIGEIAIEGPMVVPGYWRKPEESEHAIPGGRLHTGDVGFMDEDGWFYIVDRAKDQINAAGYKVWPRDVEDVLYQHPAVREAAVVGVPHEYRGETVKAYVSLGDGARVTPPELVAFCRERMAAYKYPREVEILDELPKTHTGKILRKSLRDR